MQASTKTEPIVSLAADTCQPEGQTKRRMNLSEQSRTRLGRFSFCDHSNQQQRQPTRNEPNSRRTTTTITSGEQRRFIMSTKASSQLWLLITIATLATLSLDLRLFGGVACQSANGYSWERTSEQAATTDADHRHPSGRHDWPPPAELAQQANQTLSASGAAVASGTALPSPKPARSRVGRASIAVGGSLGDSLPSPLPGEQLDAQHETPDGAEDAATGAVEFGPRRLQGGRGQASGDTASESGPSGAIASHSDSSPADDAASADDPSLAELDSAPGEPQPAASSNGLAVNTNQLAGPSKLRIVRLLAPEATQNATQNVTIDCMFKFDKKLDQRLTIKWFFNDELEPIYQWIPELNKRVYSDKYERFLDKSYEVSEDVDFMLQAYKWLLAPPAATSTNRDSRQQEHSDAAATTTALQEDRAQLEASRSLLANRLNKLAKLGGRHSRQLLESLRAALYMDQPAWSRFRALRLLRPTTELDGRFTCSVSSLDGDDLRSTKLTVYEPAGSFTFNVSRVSGQHYNLTCQAGQVFPRPTLALFRYRAGPLDAAPSQQQQQQPPALRPYANRPRLAATLLRQEPIPGTQTQLTARQQQDYSSQTGSSAAVGIVEPAPSDTAPSDSPTLMGSPLTNQQAPFAARHSIEQPPQQPQQQPPPVFDIASWALVDEASLSSNVVTQFECLLSIEGTNYEQRQSLALQRGWHVNSASVLASRSTLVGLFGALASLLCLLLALVTSMLIFRLLRRHAKNRVHQQKGGGSAVGGGRKSCAASNSHGTGTTGAAHISAPLESRAASGLTLASSTATHMAPSPSQQSNNSLGSSLSTAKLNMAGLAAYRGKPPMPLPAQRHVRSPTIEAYDAQSDGVYRVPELTGGTRLVIRPGSRHLQHQQQQQQQQQHLQLQQHLLHQQQQQHFYGLPNNLQHHVNNNKNQIL